MSKFIGINLIDVENYTYTYGFNTDVTSKKFVPGLNEHTIELIVRKKKEPNFLLQWRIRAYRYWVILPEPVWSSLEYQHINYSKIIYYSSPKVLEDSSYYHEKNILLETYRKLNIDLIENTKKFIAIDAVFDSVSVITTFQRQLFLLGVVFSSFSSAIKNYPSLVKKYIGSVVPFTDNYFVALNSAVFSDGSFCYIPRKIKCPIELSTYFRINTVLVGQFERTLIIVDIDSCVSYLEGCTASIKDENQLHAAVVEIIALKCSEVKYSTIQNWYPGDVLGKGGIYNFVTKRGLCFGSYAKIIWIQVEAGSARTWKYPSVILKGYASKGEFYSVAFTTNYQQTDTGTKMIHVGKKTSSLVFSKSVLAGFSKNIFRSLINILKIASRSTVYSQCDSLLLTRNCVSKTYPEFKISGLLNTVAHEALTGKIDYEQVFYCLQRGLSKKSAIIMIINGFCARVLTKLPMEFSIEIHNLIEKQFEGL